MVNSSRLQTPEIQQFLSSARASGTFTHAWESYRDLVWKLASQIENPRLLEVGGGRSPMFTEAEIETLNGTYTVNDIDASELSLAPQWVERLLGDIADPSLSEVTELHGTFDLVFSLMVFEHVERPEQAYKNVAKFLASGGVVVNFIPTLYALPFVVNRLLPERLTAPILRFFFPKRNPDEIPKFPAYYRWCTTTSKTERKLDSVGFRNSTIVPFYGHRYYQRIPGLRSVARRFWPVAFRRNWRSASTFAYILAER